MDNLNLSKEDSRDKIELLATERNIKNYKLNQMINYCKL